MSMRIELGFGRRFGILLFLLFLLKSVHVVSEELAVGVLELGHLLRMDNGADL